MRAVVDRLVSLSEGEDRRELQNYVSSLPEDEVSDTVQVIHMCLFVILR